MENKIPKCIIVGIQSVMPVKVTQHREIRRISVKDAAGAGIFRRSLNIVMYYKKEGDCCERGWLVAGWIKESLGRALTEQPMLSGRLRRRESCGGLELVANDSGVRLVEARVPVSLPEFVEIVKSDDKSKVEEEIVFWRDIDEKDPQFSPLFYVQVTNFESGGYSVGISCSILIADILLGTDFFTKWSQIQTSIASLPPIFHLPSLKNGHLSHLTDLPTASAAVVDRGYPIVYLVQPKTSSKIVSLEVYMKKVDAICEKSEEKDVFLFGKEQVEIHSGVKKAISDCDCDLEKLDDGVLRFEEIAFGKEKVEHSSCWIGCVSKGVVFVVTSLKSSTKLVVALPKA